MEPKVAEVVSALDNSFIHGYEEIEDNRLYLKTVLTALGHKTWFTFSVTGDVLRLDVRHVFGTIDADNRSLLEDLLKLLKMNNGGFMSTSAYLSVELTDEALHVTLQTYRTFLMKMPSDEIADEIDLLAFDLSTGMMFLPDNWPKRVQWFEKRDTESPIRKDGPIVVKEKEARNRNVASEMGEANGKR